MSCYDVILLRHLSMVTNFLNQQSIKKLILFVSFIIQKLNFYTSHIAFWTSFISSPTHLILFCDILLWLIIKLLTFVSFIILFFFSLPIPFPPPPILFFFCLYYCCMYFHLSLSVIVSSCSSFHLSFLLLITNSTDANLILSIYFLSLLQKYWLCKFYILIINFIG